jgi:hypothetical protein
VTGGLAALSSGKIHTKTLCCIVKMLYRSGYPNLSAHQNMTGKIDLAF